MNSKMKTKEVYMDTDPSKPYRMSTTLCGPGINVSPPPDFPIDDPIPYSIIQTVEPFGSAAAKDMTLDDLERSIEDNWTKRNGSI
jgi:hypothetical protein